MTQAEALACVRKGEITREVIEGLKLRDVSIDYLLSLSPARAQECIEQMLERIKPKRRFRVDADEAVT